VSDVQGCLSTLTQKQDYQLPWAARTDKLILAASGLMLPHFYQKRFRRSVGFLVNRTNKNISLNINLII